MRKFLALIMVAAMMAALAAPVFAMDKVDAITGDLTVTGFFNEKTNAVEIKSGESYTIKFNAKTTGTENWHNYILGITGGVGDPYPGADKEILILRADNWGWGGKMSDFVDNSEGNNGKNQVKFESNITDWTAFKNEMKTGLDVEIVLTRDGDTISYDAKIGTYTSKFSGKSGVALPESIYFFLTGENVVLTGISTAKNVPAAGGDNTDGTTAAGSSDTTGSTGGTGSGSGTGSTTSPATGFATAAIAIVAIGSGAYIVSKKRH